MHIESVNIKQKAKVDLLTSGDTSSKFFYAKISSRKHKNVIGKFLNEEGDILNDISLLEKEVVSYFIDLYNTDRSPHNFSNITTKFLLNDNSNEILLAQVCLEDIQNIVFNVNDDKSPSLDGFRAKFYKTHWKEIKHMLFEAINEFFNTGKFLKNINYTFITLLPKVKIPNRLGDCRSIACCNFLYKIIANILSNRIKFF